MNHFVHVAMKSLSQVSSTETPRFQIICTYQLRQVESAEGVGQASRGRSDGPRRRLRADVPAQAPGVAAQRAGQQGAG